MGLILLALGLALCGCAKKGAPEFAQNSQTRAQLKSFAVEKESQARALASADGHTLSPTAEKFFSAVENANWKGVTNDYVEMQNRMKNDSILYGSWWQPVLETFGAAEQFGLGDTKYATIYGHDIIQSIPPGSIYFGGTDPGRFVITAMQKSQANGDPFFTVSHKPMADTTYLNYLGSIYGGKIYVPTTKDEQKCYDDYYAVVQRRMQSPQSQPDDNGYVAIEALHALLTRVIFDRNTNREFYIEESFPFPWMYPYLEPHGLIFKLNRQPLVQLSNNVVQRDYDYWTKTISPMIGNWLNDDTSVKDVSGFAEKVFLNHNFNNFTGDTNFVLNGYSHRMFSKERSSIAGLYMWRAQNTTDLAEKGRMNDAADFAFRQSWALCPYSPEVVFRYVQFLITQQRASDALMVAETAEKLAPDQDQAEQLNQLIEQLKRYQNK